jgi:phage-related protein
MAYKLQFGSYVLPKGFAPVEEGLVAVVPSDKTAKGDGAASIVGTLDKRVLPVRGFLSADILKNLTGGRTTLRQELDALKSALYAVRQGTLYFGVDDRFYRNVQCAGIPISYGETEYGRQATVQINFEAADPFAYAVATSNDSWSPGGSGATKVITSAGSAGSQPVFSITVGGAGALTIAFTVTNNTNSQQLTLTGSCNGGDVIVVDTLNHTVTIGGVDKYGALFDGLWMALNPGANTLQVNWTGTAITTVATAWQERSF